MSCCDSVPAEVKQAITETGVNVNILTPAGQNLDTEFIALSEYKDPAKQALTSIYVACFDTAIEVGYIVTVLGKELIVTAKEPEMCGNVVASYLLSCHIVNVTGELQTYNQNPGYNADYVRQKNWQVQHQNVKGYLQGELSSILIADSLVSPSLSDVLALSAYFTVEAGDRFITSEGLRFRVEDVDVVSIPGLKLSKLSNDTRD